MASPVTGDFNSTVAPSDHHLPITDLNLPNPAEHNLTSAQSVKTSDFPDASAPVKRKKRKPKRYEGSETDALSNPSSSSLSLWREKSPIKGFKTPDPSSPAMIRAVEFQNSLGTDFPSCIKTMSTSQVISGFWLGLPLHFCKSYLPKEDATIVLEDEYGAQFEVKYIAYKYGISAGWKRFVVRHNLSIEDILIFQLVESTKFKVYILDVNDSSEAGHALSLLNLAAHTEQSTPVTPSLKTKKKKHPESLSVTVSRKKHKKSVRSSRSVPPSGHHTKHSGNNSEEGGPEVLECSIPSERHLTFQEVKSFQDFHIIVKGVCIDHELPHDVRMAYYKLCICNKEYLHDGVSKDLYGTLLPGMVGQIVRIADEIKRCKITTITKEDIDRWEKSLNSFELLGMKVGFLRDKVHTLATLVFESEAAVDIKQYVEARNEHRRAEDEIKKVAAKLKELREEAIKFAGIAGTLKHKVEKYEHKFQEEVDKL
ncbi:putative transcription factor B3-Domain family [Helianthus annuus]|uniref:Putative DNA-binding pseudobarrel domain-containing protein n=1 Tax=Helianthus annuus TaxID=4232 RepID=A0A251SBT1_HELAN|nr:B3 domain-containing protein Os01g0234100 [Helianthus annuus]KAF5766280.1 putative transcription factor B3-Domain family [Helianthus annuus]KAJ0452698.1 putative transcription factor B3-Domain family [Helianthus annuus]KAJ0457675.1 putative transcription factor B3-Domain family [Helianthus annuus]KAJ0474612.1 putative transcription factor B3-Domain family [Helianthus annuus]KAJ0650169.1 putative transcription factor B3-Domain family [Helianthus annuus]